MLIGAHHRPEGYVWEITTRMKTENLVAAWPRSELSYCVVSLMIQSCLTVCFLWVGSLSDGVFVNECRSIEALGMCWWWRFYKTKARHFSRAIWIWTQVIFFTNIAYFSQADQKRLTPQPPWSTTSFFWTSHKWNLPTTPPTPTTTTTTMNTDAAVFEQAVPFLKYTTIFYKVWQNKVKWPEELRRYTPTKV